MTLVFLSHSGVDTRQASGLKRKLEDAGIPVWFDKADLKPGSEGWQKQIEKAIETEATAFVVYVGSRGIVNWVDAETRLAVSKAISGGGKFPVIPVLSKDSQGSGALPGFVKQFQSVRDVENRPEEWRRLLEAIQTEGEFLPEHEPFFGLRWMDVDRSHLFFGRNVEAKAVGDIVASNNIVLISGDSGSGKSSLARAGLGRLWLGGEVSLRTGQDPRDHDWRVIRMQPRLNPRRELRQAVSDAAGELDLLAADKTHYSRLAEEGNASDVREALRCGLDSQRTRTLLLVDQLEELTHPNVSAERKRDFAKLIADLADPSDPSVAVAMTMRSDYTNLLRIDALSPIFDRLEANKRAPRYRLRKMTNEGLRDCVIEPLRLAGRPKAEAEGLADLVLDDVGERPGDLALLQFALTETWKKRGLPRFDDDLLKAYAGVGRIEAALPNAAKDIYQTELGGDANEAEVEATFIRLGSLSGSGPVRRVAKKEEFSVSRWEMVQKLAEEDGHRLVMIQGEDEAEIAHEALLTQWDELNGWLLSDMQAKQDLDVLADRALQRRDSAELELTRKTANNFLTRILKIEPVPRPENLLQKGDVDRFGRLMGTHPSWLSETEAVLVEESRDYHLAVEERERAIQKGTNFGFFGLMYLVAVVGVFAILMGYFYLQNRSSTREATSNLVSALSALSDVATLDGNFERAAKLVLVSATIDGAELSVNKGGLLFQAIPELVKSIGPPMTGHKRMVNSVAFSPDGKRIASGGHDRTLRIWDTATGEQIGDPLMEHERAVSSVAFSPNGRRIVSGSFDGSLRIWDAGTGAQIDDPLEGHEDKVLSVAFSPDGSRIVSGGEDKTLRIWDTKSGEQFGEPLIGHESSVPSVAYSPDGKLIVSGSSSGELRIWDANTGEPINEPSKIGSLRLFGGIRVAISPDSKQIASGSFFGKIQIWDAKTGIQIGNPLTGHQATVFSVAFSPDGTRIASGGGDGTVRIWDAATGSQIGDALTGHERPVYSVAFSSDGTRIVSGSDDGTVLIWDATDIYELNSRLLCSKLNNTSLEQIELELGLDLPEICTEEQ